MKRITTFLVGVVAVAAMLAGCGPSIKYHEKDHLDVDTSYIPFALMGSRVTIGKPAAESQAQTKDKVGVAAAQQPSRGSDNPSPENTSQGISLPMVNFDTAVLKNTSLTVTPAEAMDTRRYMEGRNNWFSETSLSVDYLSQTWVPTNVGVSVQDNTIKFVQAVGATAAVMGTVFALREQPHGDKIYLPAVMDFSDPKMFKDFDERKDKSKDSEEVCLRLGVNGDNKNEHYAYCYTFKADTMGVTLYPYNRYFKFYENEFANTVPVSSCINVNIRIVKCQQFDKEDKCTKPEKPELVHYGDVSIADPYNIRPLPLPPNGSVQIKGICNGSIASQSSSNPGAFDVLGEMAKQADSAWKAWHPSK